MGLIHTLDVIADYTPTLLASLPVIFSFLEKIVQCTAILELSSLLYALRGFLLQAVVLYKFNTRLFRPDTRLIPDTLPPSPNYVYCLFSRQICQAIGFHKIFSRFQKLKNMFCTVLLDNSFNLMIHPDKIGVDCHP